MTSERRQSHAHAQVRVNRRVVARKKHLLGEVAFALTAQQPVLDNKVQEDKRPHHQLEQPHDGVAYTEWALMEELPCEPPAVAPSTQPDRTTPPDDQDTVARQVLAEQPSVNGEALAERRLYPSVSQPSYDGLRFVMPWGEPAGQSWVAPNDSRTFALSLEQGQFPVFHPDLLFPNAWTIGDGASYRDNPPRSVTKETLLRLACRALVCCARDPKVGLQEIDPALEMFEALRATKALPVRFAETGKTRLANVAEVFCDCFAFPNAQQSILHPKETLFRCPFWRVITILAASAKPTVPFENWATLEALAAVQGYELHRMVAAWLPSNGWRDDRP